MDSCPNLHSRPSLFCLSFITASSSALSIQPEEKMVSLPRWVQRPSWDDCDESSHVLSLHLPSYIQFPPATNASVLFCFIVICLNILQSANSPVSTGQSNALFYDLKHWDFSWMHWYLVIGNRSWHFNRLQWVILHSPFFLPLAKLLWNWFMKLACFLLILFLIIHI